LGQRFVGWLLAWSGGYQGETVMNHLWGGIATSAACLYLRMGAARLPLARQHGPRATFLHSHAPRDGRGHFVDQPPGSVVAHGDDYLTKHMPPSIRLLLGVAPAPAPAAKPAASTAAPSLYVTQIAPIFEKHCVACHKPSKHKANLRMDTYELLMAGGDSGPPVVAGSLEKSDLYRRITLPKDDEEFMPTDGKPALSPAEIELIADWITAGAKP